MTNFLSKKTYLSFLSIKVNKKVLKILNFVFYNLGIFIADYSFFILLVNLI